MSAKKFSSLFKSDVLEVTAFAPSSIGNVAVGFDILGQAIAGVGDTVVVRNVARSVSSDPLVRIESATGLPTEPEKNTATAGMITLINELATRLRLSPSELDLTFLVQIKKGIPLSSGMGGSAASAVAGLVALNSLLKKPLKPLQLIPYILVGEAVASGSKHGDNVVPALLGGLQLISSMEPVTVNEIPVPPSILTVLVHPHFEVKTEMARGILKREVDLNSHIHGSADLAAFIHGCHKKDLSLISKSLRDTVIEPQRQKLIPGFEAVKAAALKSGALGSSISGAGPSVFAWFKSPKEAKTGAAQMIAAFKTAGLKSEAWISKGKSPGAKIIKVTKNKKGQNK